MGRAHGETDDARLVERMFFEITAVVLLVLLVYWVLRVEGALKAAVEIVKNHRLRIEELETELAILKRD